MTEPLADGPDPSRLDGPSQEGPVKIGPFRIVHTLGTGGMGTVYLGERSELFAQRVAVKLLHLEQSRGALNPSLEAHTLKSLDHPNIVRLLDSGTTNTGQRYLIMEYVDGIAIDLYCTEQQLTPSQRLHLILEVMDALDYAHRHLVLHADLKPANILVTPQGRVKLLDFGIAFTLSSTNQSLEGNRNGFTPAFASPEQRAGGRLTIASDIYTLGVLTARLFTAAVPLDRDLQAILEKSQSAAPEDRYASIDAFRNDLRLYLKGHPVAARSISTLTRVHKTLNRHRLAASLALTFTAAVLLSTIGIILQSAHAAHQRRIAQDRLHDLVRLTGTLEGELYDSVASLPQSDAARNALLAGASDTLDKLSTDDHGDIVLCLELAQQYERQARLRLSAHATSAQHAQALADVYKAIAVLQHIPKSGREQAAIRDQTEHLLILKDTLTKS